MKTFSIYVCSKCGKRFRRINGICCFCPICGSESVTEIDEEENWETEMEKPEN